MLPQDLRTDDLAARWFLEILLIPLALFFLGAPILAIVALVWASRLDRRLRALERNAIDAIDMRGRYRPAEAEMPPPDAYTEPPVNMPGVTKETVFERPLFVEKPPPAQAAEPSGAGAPGIEMLIGTRWLNVAGIVTLLFAVSFFLKYAYENAWIGPRGRVAIGVAAGLIAIVIGESARRRGHRVFSQGLAGGGLAALYLSFFFAFRLYSLIEIAPAFALMAAVTAFGVALALLQDSLAVAVLAFVGAYLTPVLLSTGQDAAEFLFSYLAILAAGALGVTWFRRWRALDILAFAGTALLYTGWYESHYTPQRFTVAVIGLSTFFLIFLLVPYGHNFSRRVMAVSSDHILSMANATFTFCFLYQMIYHDSPSVLGFVALGLSGCYAALGVMARRRLPEDKGLSISVTGISIAFLTLAVPLQLGLHGITLAWAAEGLVFLYLGFRYEAFLTRAAGLCVLGLSVARLFARHTPLHARPFTFLLNPTFGTWVAVVLAFCAAAFLYRRNRARANASEPHLASATAVAAGLLLLVGLNLETWEYFKLWSLPEDDLAGSLMILWAVFAPALYLVGRILDERPLKTTSSLLTALSTVPFLMLIARVVATSDPLFGSFVFWMGMLGVLSFFVASRLREIDDGPRPEGSSPRRLLAGAGTALLLVLLTSEVYSHYLLLESTPETAATNRLKALLGVSILWAVFSSGLMTVGFLRTDRAVRYASFGLFGVTLLKVFFLDMGELRAIHRIVSFLILGLLLVAGSFVYSRFRARISMVLLAAAVGLMAGGLVAAAFDPPAWRLMRDIDLEGSGDDRSFAWFELDEEVLKEARADLADLRVVDRSSEEVASVVIPRRGGTREATWTPRILNRVRLPGGAARVDLEFDGRQTRNLLRVETVGESFRRRVKVEGSDDGAGWAILTDHAWIHRLAGAGGTPATRLDDVALPDNDYRRIRVTVFPMADEKSPLSITGATARRQTFIAAETAPLRSAWTQTQDLSRRTTTLEIDFGYRNARPFEVSLDFEQASFRRAYRLEGRAERQMTLEKGRTEDGLRIEQEIEAPWIPLGSGSVIRMPKDGAGAAAINDTRIALRGDAARYLRVILEDQDDAPLRLRAMEARCLIYRLVFSLRPGGSYKLYYGNPRAVAPRYDLTALLPDLDVRPPLTVRLGPPGPNPNQAVARQTPFSERYPWVLWAVMLGVMAALALILKRNVKSMPRS